MSKANRLRAAKARVEHVKGRIEPQFVSVYDGYTYVELEDPATGCVEARRIHELVWLTFKGPTPAGHEVYHLDGNKRNNRLDNLGCRPIVGA